MPMSMGNLEMVPVAKRSLINAYDDENEKYDSDDIHRLPQVIVELGECDVAEIYTPPRLPRRCRQVGLRTGFCVDLTTKKPDGEYWDLSRPEDVRLVEELQEEEEPWLLVGSPPCTTFSQSLKLSHTAEEIE
jgi:hypothetical protein